MPEIEKKQVVGILFKYRNLYGLMDRTLTVCMQTRDCGSSSHGDVMKIDAKTTSPRSIYSQKF